MRMVLLRTTLSFLTDFSISIAVMIQESLPYHWFTRRSFLAQKTLLYQWLLLGCIIALAYKSILLSTLIPIRYEKTINTIYELDASGLPLLMPKSTSAYNLIATDKRETMRRIFENRIELPFNGMVPQDMIDMCGKDCNNYAQYRHSFYFAI